MIQNRSPTHDVFNQSPPFEDIDLFIGDRPMARLISKVRTSTPCLPGHCLEG
jgi:hypothetical protein